jgi:hypothetical protein
MFVNGQRDGVGSMKCYVSLSNTHRLVIESTINDLDDMNEHDIMGNSNRSVIIVKGIWKNNDLLQRL